MSRLPDYISLVREKKGKILSFFLTAGFPQKSDTPLLIYELENAGADIIELGIPFSDPIADGPMIQESSYKALHNGITLRETIKIAGEVRKRTSIPIILMGYMNPIHHFGLSQFLNICKDIGIDGIIIADLPLEESGEYIRCAHKNNISTIFIASPTTPNSRLVKLDTSSNGFLYCVSITGVTGERKKIADRAESFLRRARNIVTKNPILVGFGISTPEDAHQLVRYCDGVVIGSALIRILADTTSTNVITAAGKFARSFRNAIDLRE